MKRTKIDVRSVDDKVVVDSADVARATEAAIRRHKAEVQDIVVDGKVVDEEILVNTHSNCAG